MEQERPLLPAFALLNAIMLRAERRNAHVVVRHDGTIVSWSPEATALCGWTGTEAVGQDLARLVVPDDLRATYRRWVAQEHGPEPASVVCQGFRTRAVHKSGHQIPVVVDGQLVRDTEDGVYFLGWIWSADATTNGRRP